MLRRRRTALGATLLLAMTAAPLTGCERDVSTGPAPSPVRPTAAGCPTALARATEAVRRAERTDARWTGPVAGPRAARGKEVVYVAQSMTNPGVAGTARGVRDAARAAGWSVRVLDGQGTPAGIQAAFGEAVTLRPAGIVVGGFDPRLTSRQVAAATARHIVLVGWHAVDAPGPSADPPLFSNVTTRVEDVARTSADWVITHSRGRGGAVLFTDASIPFARHKSQLIRAELATCPGVRLLAEENIPLPDTGSRTPQAVSSLLSRYGARWTHSVAINDVYFADAAPALRAARRKGTGAPFNIGAGDGDPSAFERINEGAFQTATVPEPLAAQGWQIVDEFNRAFAGAPASGYVTPAHVATAANTGGATTWDPPGYRTAYRRIWTGGGAR
ncbi:MULTISPECIES: substrate-binding domain-containing protein [Streptomyces]|uniref:substrate-binding domain-containing protein n=1 Tax=Streptomyces sp. NPDC029704 TaxID=3156920 RepID=UPI0031D25E9B